MVSIKKKGAVYGVIALMLCAAVYLNWSYVRTPDDMTVAAQDSAQDASTAVSTTPQAIADSAETMDQTMGEPAQVVSREDYFAQSRLSRQQARDEAIGILKETVENEKADDNAKSQASQQISVMAEYAVQEASVESLIKAKGYAEAVVFIGQDSVNVVVQPPEGGFKETDAAKICDIVVTETGASADKIKIVEAA